MGTAHGEKLSAECDLDSGKYANPDLGGDINLDLDDLAMDEEEYPVGTSMADLIAMAREVVDELSHFDQLWVTLQYPKLLFLI